MSVFIQNNTFTSTVTSEAASPLVAGVFSQTGLVALFGNTGSNGTSEQEIGLMTIDNINNWFSRLYSRSYGISGPTGYWANEWWAVHNYLQYGGICVIGGTGSTGDYYSNTGYLEVTNTPLHNKSLVDLDVVFETGNTFSAGAAASIASVRKDCVAFVGNNKKLTGIPGLASNYSSVESDFGITSASEYVAFVGGRKKFVAGVGSAVNILEANLSPDAAGCVARSIRDAKIWSAPAGKTRGRILGVVAMQQNFGETDIDYISGGKVNPIVVYPGEGTFLMGNKTAYVGTGALSKINSILMISYIKKEVLSIARGLLFEINDAATRQKLISLVTPILETVKAGNGISNYRIVCDDTNNTTAVVEANELVVDIYVNPTYTAETLVIRITNSSSSEAYSS